jgi:hypothetical protein
MLTKRGSSVIGSLILFFLITNFFITPIFSIASSVLLFIFSLEAVKFNLALRSLNRFKFIRHIDTDFTIVGESSRVELKADHLGSRTGAILEIEDLVPSGLKVVDGSSSIKGIIKGPQRFVTSYIFEAMEMGKKRFEGVETSLYDRLGLFATKKKFNCSSLVNVNPRKPSIYAEIPGRQRLLVRPAEKGSMRRSLGTEIIGIRDYVPGDDHRLISWKSMAKSPTFDPMTKEQEQTRLQNLASSIADITFDDFGEEQIVEFVKTHISKKSLIIVVTDLPYPKIIDPLPFQSLRMDGHLVSIMVLHTPTFFKAGEDKDERERLARLILDGIEENHERVFISGCSSLGLSTYLCTPDDIALKMIETFAEARRRYST